MADNDSLFRPPPDEDPLVKRLVLAGQPGGLDPQEFLAFSVFTALAMPVLGWVALYYYDVEFGLLSIAAFGAFGAVYPGLWLGERINTRRKQVVRALPFVLDNLTMSMEAGLNFTQAVERVLANVKKKKTPIEEELHIVLQEVHMGKTRAEALTGFAQRIESHDVKSFVGAIIQGEKLGTPLG